MKVNDTGFFFQKRSHFETSQSVLCRVKTVLDKSLIVMLKDGTTAEIPKSSFIRLSKRSNKMLGAREYATLFKSGRYGRLYVESGEHARGKTFCVWILPSEAPLLTHPRDSSSAVQVYGVTGGNPGWTETYGWLHRGKWEQDFYALVEERRAEVARNHAEHARKIKEAEEKELERQASLLAAYDGQRGLLDVSDLKAALRDATAGPAFPEKSEEPPTPTVAVRADDLLDLITQHDCWAGSFDPESAEEWRQKYADLREFTEGLVNGSFENTGHNHFVTSLPLPADHWLYAPQAPWDAARDESSECPLPVLSGSLRTAVIAAARYAIRGATVRGTEPDFDPDALVMNLCYALCGTANVTAASSASK